MGAERRAPAAWALGGVAALAALVQLWVIGPVLLGPDESVYASQVSPLIPPSPFTAPRARGTSWLAAPIIEVTSDQFVWRTYLTVLAAVALVLGFWPWLRLLPRWVPVIAAALLSGLWVSVFYAPTLMPNYWVAVCGVAATGWLLRARTGPWWALLSTAIAVVAAALLRPPDSAFLVVGLLGVALLVPGTALRRRLVSAVTVLAALVLGWLPWLIEAVTRYGGIRARLDAGSDYQGGLHPQPGFLYAFRSVDGPLLCRPCGAGAVGTPWYGYLWLLAPLLLIIVGIVGAWHLRYRRAVAGALLVAACSAVPYLLLTGYGAPRFLLPAYALLSLPAGFGVWWAWQRLAAPDRWARWLARAAVVVVIGALLASQAVVLDHVRTAAYESRELFAAQLRILAGKGLRPPCAVAGRLSNIRALLSDCRKLDPQERRPPSLRALGRAGPVAYFAKGRTPPPGTAGWTPVQLPGLDGRRGPVAFLSPAATP